MRFSRPGFALILSLLSPLVLSAEPGLSRSIPVKGLTSYLEFDGIDAHAATWEATEANAILTKTPTGTMVNDLALQVVGKVLRDIPGAKLSTKDVTIIARQVARQGFVAATFSGDETVTSGMIVIAGAAAKENRAPFQRLFRPMIESKNGRITRLRSREIHQFVSQDVPKDPPSEPIPWLSWWIEKDDLIIIAQQSGKKDSGQISAVLDAIDGKAPNASTHPGRVAAMAEGRGIPGFEASGLFFVEPGVEGGLRKILESRSYLPYTGVVLPSANGIDPSSVRTLRSPESPPLFPLFQESPQPRPGSPFPTVFPTEPAPVFPPRSGDDSQKPALPVIARPEASPPPQRVVPSPEPEPPGLVVLPPPPTPPEGTRPDLVNLLGLKAITRIAGRFGFQKGALFSVVRVEVPSPRKGVLAWFETKPFRKDKLPAIPATTKGFTIVSFDATKASDEAVFAMKTLLPDATASIEIVEKAFQTLTGLKTLGDFFKPMASPMSLVMLRDDEGHHGPYPVLVAALDNSEAFAKQMDGIAERVNSVLRDRDARTDDSNKGERDDPPMLALERLPAPERGYRLTSPSMLVPWAGNGISPTVMIGKSSVAIGFGTEVARTALAAETRPENRQSVPADLMEALPEELIMLSVVDASESHWPGLLANLPATVQLLSSIAAETLKDDDKAETDFLTLLGVPGPGGFRVRFDPAKAPSEDQIQAHLFPSVTAVSRDDRGFHVFLREAVPFTAPMALNTGIKWNLTWEKEGIKRNLKFFGFFGFGQ